MKYFMTTAAIAALVAMPATAQAQLFGGFDNNSVLGGLAGAGIGGAIGSNLAGSGNRDEGTAIGAALGGLAGVGFGNSRSNFAGNPFAGSFNPGFTGNSLLATGVGAGIGGAIGSNLAGSGVRQEGTAIGAVLGGLAGYGLANRGQGQQGFNGGGGFAPAGFNGGGFAPTGFKSRYGAPNFGNAGIIGGGLGLPPRGGVSYVPSGQYIAGPVIPVTRYAQPTARPVMVSQPRTGFTAPAPAITVAAPNVRLAPPVRQRTVSVAPRVQQRPIVRATRVLLPVPSVYADCPAGMKLLKNGSCLETTNTIMAKPVGLRNTLPPLSSAGLSAPAGTVSVAAAPAPILAPIVSQLHSAPAAPEYANCPSGTSKQSDGTCLEATSYVAPAPVYSAPAPVYSAPAPAASCPSGTRKQSDGTCLEATSYSAPAPVYTAPAPAPSCPAGTSKQSDGTCLSPTITHSTSSTYTATAPVMSAPATVAHAPSVVQYEEAPARSSAHSSAQEYCYSDTSKRYDALGRELMARGSGCNN